MTMDKTYCPFSHTCAHGADCERAMTEGLRHILDTLGLHVSQFAERPTCWKAVSRRGKVNKTVKERKRKEDL